MNKINTLFILFLHLITLNTFSQSIWHVPGDYLYIHYDMHNSTTSFTFDSNVDRGRIIRVGCGFFGNHNDSIYPVYGKNIYDSNTSVLYMNSLIEKYSKEEIRSELTREIENLDFSKNWMESYNDSLKKFMVAYHDNFILNIMGDKIRINIPETKAIGSDYANKVINKEEANLRLREAFKKHLLYKLIMEE